MAKRTEIKRFNNFILYRDEGVASNNTPVDGLVVKSIGLAEKHVVDVDMDSFNNEYNGTPIKYKYSKVYVRHGMRGRQDTLAETKEYIDVLNEAIDVAFEVQKYCILNGYWAG